MYCRSSRKDGLVWKNDLAPDKSPLIVRFLAEIHRQNSVRGISVMKDLGKELYAPTVNSVATAEFRKALSSMPREAQRSIYAAIGEAIVTR